MYGVGSSASPTISRRLIFQWSINDLMGLRTALVSMGLMSAPWHHSVKNMERCQIDSVSMTVQAILKASIYLEKQFSLVKMPHFPRSKGPVNKSDFSLVDGLTMGLTTMSELEMKVPNQFFRRVDVWRNGHQYNFGYPSLILGNTMIPPPVPCPGMSASWIPLANEFSEHLAKKELKNRLCGKSRGGDLGDA